MVLGLQMENDRKGGGWWVCTLNMKMQRAVVVGVGGLVVEVQSPEEVMGAEVKHLRAIGVDVENSSESHSTD
ncbi:hypothetical protein L6452_36700 [Arctium lappa]|uniref:Uncharacterized protein n=1 Tax=Arctium lappa TaxID=4217 RepID=A0ACB8YB31_ARCLA|nr:hypothetical protein L6452_36700 [Arctium lappa]